MAPSRDSWTRWQRLKNGVIFNLALTTMWLVGRLPLGLAKAVGAAVGRLGWIVAASERR